MKKNSRKKNDLPPFARTTCACDGCQVGCRTMPGCLIPGDVERISAHCGHADDQEWVTEHFAVSEGATVGKRLLQNGEPVLVQFSVPTIVPAQRENGHCVFLTEDGRCSIHTVSPFGCAYHDLGMGREEAHRRSHYAVQRQIESHQQNGSYSQQCQSLAAAGAVATSVVARRAAYVAAIEALPKRNCCGDGTS